MKLNLFASICGLALGLAFVAPIRAQEPLAQPAAKSTPAPSPVPSQLNGSPSLRDPQFEYYKERRAVARGNNLYCAGYIQNLPVTNLQFEVVGGEQEQEQRVYTQGNLVYINAGADRNVKVGDLFVATRPRGKFGSPFTEKKGKLGIYVQELGTVRIVQVKPRVSIAQIETSCETILLGDVLQAYSERVAPEVRVETELDRFRDSSGKAKGRIVLARDGQETLSRDQVVYIDLGAEDKVKAGQYLTIYRPLGTGNITGFSDKEVVVSEDYGFESRKFRGGKFSNQGPRRKGTQATGDIVTTPEAKSRRPEGLRKIVGEAVILNVQERTATVIITRTAQEIHTGDFVELQ